MIEFLQKRQTPVAQEQHSTIQVTLNLIWTYYRNKAFSYQTFFRRQCLGNGLNRVIRSFFQNLREP